MTLETTSRKLIEDLYRLGEALAELRTTVVEYHPPHGEMVLIDLFRDPADDLLGLQKEALNAAQEAYRSVEPRLNLERARRRLSACHQKFQELSRRYHGELMSYERIDPLVRFGRRRGGEWRQWTGSVKEDLERCWPRVEAVDQSLLECWQELAGRVGANYVSVQTTSIGQLGALERKTQVEESIPE